MSNTREYWVFSTIRTHFARNTCEYEYSDIREYSLSKYSCKSKYRIPYIRKYSYSQIHTRSIPCFVGSDEYLSTHCTLKPILTLITSISKWVLVATSTCFPQVILTSIEYTLYLFYYYTLLMGMEYLHSQVELQHNSVITQYLITLGVHITITLQCQ